MRAEDLEDKIKRNRAFWERAEVPRPLLGITGTYFPVEALAAVAPTAAHLSPDDIDIEASLAACDREYESRREVMADLVWAAGALCGFPWVAAILGCKVYRAEDTFWREPVLADWAQLPSLRPSPDNPWLRKLRQVTAALVSHAQGRYPVGPSLALGPVSVAASLRGPHQLALDLYDYPAQVRELLATCTEACVAAGLAQIELLPRFHGGAVNPIRHVWAPHWPTETQEDEAFMFSPEMHRRFLLQSQVQLGRALPGAYIHLHGTQLHTLDAIVEVAELAAIEITPDVGQSALELVPAIRKALARKPVLVHGFISLPEMRELMACLPARGLCLATRTDSPAAAAEMMAQLSADGRCG